MLQLQLHMGLKLLSDGSVFLDKYQIETNSGLTMSVNKPTKYVSNPIYGSTSNTFDRDESYERIIRRAFRSVSST